MHSVKLIKQKATGIAVLISLTLFALPPLAGSDDSASDAVSDFYTSGPLSIQVISRSGWQAPAPLDIYTPREEDSYPVIIFMPGFTASKRDYETILQHVASHGFIVIAPQMYREDCYPCAPPPTFEAAKGIKHLRWIKSILNRIVPVGADLDRIGIAGQSRGGQIAFRVALAEDSAVAAVAAVDPVDGLQMFGQAKVTDREWRLTAPAYILGTGLGPVMPDNATFPLPCAPSDIGHVVFYDKCPGPAWHAVAVDNGHNDMIDEEDFVEGGCPGGPDRDAMRAFTAGTLAAFFSVILKENTEALSVFSSPEAAPVGCTMESK